MTVNEAILTRRSIRKYSANPVEQEKLDALLEYVRMSPSAANEQNWRLIIVRDAEKKNQLYEASYNQPWVLEAPCVLIMCGTSRRTMDCGQPTEVINPTIAMSFLLLKAHELGLGTCWLGHFMADKVRAALDIPLDVTIVAMSPLGYPEETPPTRHRRLPEEIVGWDKF